MRAFVFPGQGSQVVGMGQDFYEHFKIAKDTFDEVDSVLAPLLHQKLSTIIFEGPADTLTQTLYTQPALMTVSIAIYRTLEYTLNVDLTAKAAFMAGHSLGEYSALCAAGVISLADTAQLLYYRGKAMTECAAIDSSEEGSPMAAIIGLEMDVLEDLTSKAGCFIANDNGGGQVVVSGAKTAITTIIDLATKAGAKRALPLNVSAPFHCPLMQPAADIMAEKIAETSFYPAKTPVITNVSAAAQSDPNLFKRHLVEQVCGRVRWRESVLFMASQGVTDMVEMGSGKVLAGLCKRIAPDINASAINSIEDIKNFI